MNQFSLLAGALAASLLAGCQVISEQQAETAPSAHCLDEIPTLADSSCILESWVDFGLAAQRGDGQWRENILNRVDGDSTRDRLSRAVVYTWSGEDHWARASELFKADISAAPSSLQPLLQQWLNALEMRRELTESYAESEASRRQLTRERDELAEKLDALTAIEERFNSRN